MAFNPINKIKSTAVLLPLDHIDTDQIIPARFLKATSREGFGIHLFDSWRHLENGQPNPEFVLNGKNGQGEILLTGENFGCGSSREHAVWALIDYGFRVVIAKSFADIFKGNALNNGMVPVALSDKEHKDLLDCVRKSPDTIIEIDLSSQTLKAKGFAELLFNFEINPFRKECLLAGTDLIDFLISQKDEIINYEQKLKI